ncbi:hypothetical protein V8E36_009313 [Tilletia maclaganii]
MSNARDGVVTAYKNFAPEAQTQSLPGLDKDMEPHASHFEIEKWDHDGKPYLQEYESANRLVDRAHGNKPKSCIVTGGDSGIGRAVAIAFAREGARVTIAHLPQEKEDAEKTVQLIKEASTGSKEVQAIAGDLMEEKHVQDLIKQHVDRYGGLDILVNNASKQIVCEDFAEIDLANVESTFRSNILAMHAMVKYALPHLKRGSSIINTSSVTAFKGSKGMVDYSSTKAAILGFTRSLALQLAPKGIRVNAVAMGPIYTPLQPASRSADNMEDWSVGGLPLHGRPGQPAELAGTYVFLADSGTSNLITGQTIHVNSGQWFGS